jgi:two-component system phosphate regulon sensor histidine kinase PhoR
MKRNRTGIFIAISSIALLIVLIIQVNWILQTARIKEEFFNEKANMVLSRTAEALSADKQTCRHLETCIGENDIHKIDSLFTHYMKFYNFHIDYSFEVVNPGFGAAKNQSVLAKYIYYKPLEEEAGKKLGLKLIFPAKRQYILAEMGSLFITSVILIFIVLILFWRTTLSLIKEKRISENTTDFLNNMTHEFKTPLTNIVLAGRLMTKDSTIHEDKIKHYSEIILGENERLRLQVERVLSMTALERGEIPLHKTKLNFHEVIDDSLKCIGIQIDGKQGNIKLETDADNFMIIGDKAYLTNALCNLIDNAIKYSKEKPELFIQTKNSKNNLIIKVSDKGIGIEKEYQKKVFDKFFRVPTGNVHDVKGFGLGLAYVKKIIELHNGTVELLSEKGKGTTFTITLPNV